MDAISPTRRRLLAGLGFVGALPLVYALKGRAQAAPVIKYEVNLTPAQWQTKLSPAAFRVLRQAGTEIAFTSPLNDEHRAGVFGCAGCGLPLFASKTKFDSGTGWPSFYAPLAKAVVTHTDSTLGMERTEVLCRRCGGHLGHVFNDGPAPTGLRYCMNGVAMAFTPARA